jgi:hypothetical protein
VKHTLEKAFLSRASPGASERTSNARPISPIVSQVARAQKQVAEGPLTARTAKEKSANAWSDSCIRTFCGARLGTVNSSIARREEQNAKPSSQDAAENQKDVPAQYKAAAKSRHHPKLSAHGNDSKAKLLIPLDVLRGPCKLPRVLSRQLWPADAQRNG